MKAVARLVGITVDVIDAAGVEGTGAANDALNFISPAVKLAVARVEFKAR